MTANLQSKALEVTLSSKEAMDFSALAASVQRDCRTGLAWNALLLAIAATAVFFSSGSTGALSVMIGGVLGGANLVAIGWIAARVLERGEKGFESSVALLAAKFVLLVGIVGAVVLLLKPDLLPFLLGFSTSLPIVVGICVLRFGR